MKILIALDPQEYSKAIIGNAAHLAKNTLADVVLLGIQEKSTSEPDKTLSEALEQYRQDIFAEFGDGESLYPDFNTIPWQKSDGDGWQRSARGLKECSLTIRTGGAENRLLLLPKKSAVIWSSLAGVSRGVNGRAN